VGDAHSALLVSKHAIVEDSQSWLDADYILIYKQKWSTIKSTCILNDNLIHLNID
jgi:hypothetical protein